MSAKLTSSNTATTFIVSLLQNNFTENSDDYLGKIKVNFMGNIANIYGPGLNSFDAKEKNLPPREMLATVEY